VEERRPKGYGEHSMASQSLWEVRQQSILALDGELRPFGSMIAEALDLIDTCALRLEALKEPSGLVCALVLVKARNLAIGCYSLSLDALGQEGGALFRPLIECLEMLAYFRLDPQRIDEAIEDRLPSAGDIARHIDGGFRSLRTYLNSHASHLSVHPEAMKHLIDVRGGRLRLVQAHSIAVLRQNLGTLLVALTWLAIEALNCLSALGEAADDSDATRAEDIKRRALQLLENPS
jgi:hypothetical protein